MTSTDIGFIQLVSWPPTVVFSSIIFWSASANWQMLTAGPVYDILMIYHSSLLSLNLSDALFFILSPLMVIVSPFTVTVGCGGAPATGRMTTRQSTAPITKRTR